MEEETITEACTSRSHGDNLLVFSCPDQNCLKVYTQMRHLEAHICLGNHKYKETENRYDIIKKAWAEKCVAVERVHKKLITSTSNTELGDDCICKEGWALKPTVFTKSERLSFEHLQGM